MGTVLLKIYGAATGRGCCRSGASAVELKAMFVEFRELIASPELSAQLSEMDQTARGTVDHTNLQMQDLVDHATLRLMQVVAAILLAGLMYRFASPRLSRKRSKKKAEQ